MFSLKLSKIFFSFFPCWTHPATLGLFSIKFFVFFPLLVPPCHIGLIFNANASNLPTFKLFALHSNGKSWGKITYMNVLEVVSDRITLFGSVAWLIKVAGIQLVVELVDNGD